MPVLKEKGSVRIKNDNNFLKYKESIVAIGTRLGLPPLAMVRYALFIKHSGNL